MDEFGFLDRPFLAGSSSLVVRRSQMTHAAQLATRAQWNTRENISKIFANLVSPVIREFLFRRQEPAGCGITRVPERRNSKCKIHVRAALAANFHLRAASIDFLAKYSLGPRRSKRASVTVPDGSTLTRTFTLIVP